MSRLSRILGHPVGLRSRPGHGTRVWLDLPNVEGTAAPAEAHAAVWPGDELARVVAVVENDTDVRTALTALLTQWRHRVFAGADAQSVHGTWRDAGEPPLDAIVSDLRLSGSHDGLGAITELRARADANLPALILTGETDPAQMHRLIESGLPWLVKPVQPARLRSWLNSVARDRLAQR